MNHSVKKHWLRLFVMVIVMAFPSLMHAQAFHFNQTLALISVTTAQSPAHWYLEIYNDAGVDTTLRWKADCSAIPSGWVISFDDQDSNYSNVQTGDSADFTLFDSLALPQKLIIGAMTNNITGIAAVLIDVYDPADTTYRETLTYEFDVTSATATLNISRLSDPVKVEGHNICFSFSEQHAYSISAMTGQVLLSGSVSTGFVNLDDLPEGIYCLSYFEKGKPVSRKIALQ